MGTVFHKTPPPWLEQVSDLRPGESRRIGDGRKVSFNGVGYFLWDFREKEGERWEPALSLAEKLSLLRAQEAANNAAQQDVHPPLPKQSHPKDWPVEARVWMHKAQFTNDEIVKTGAYWNADLQRVVLPYQTLSGQQAWIARQIGGKYRHGPKYLMPAGVSRGGGALVRAGVSRTNWIVITEDLLSSYRVAWGDGTDAVALQGTSLDRDSLVLLNNRYDGVFVWLDPDRPGQQGATNIIKRIGRFGMQVKRVSSDRDPKYLTAQEIKAALDAAKVVA